MSKTYRTGLGPHQQSRRDHRDLDRTQRRHTSSRTVHWLLRPTTAAATHYSALGGDRRIIAESATALARHKAGGL